MAPASIHAVALRTALVAVLLAFPACLPGQRPPAGGRAALERLPADADLAVVLDGAGLREAPLHEVVGPWLERLAGGAAGVRSLREEAGVDPLEDVDLLLAASGRDSGRDALWTSGEAWGRLEAGPIETALREGGWMETEVGGSRAFRLPDAGFEGPSEPLLMVEGGFLRFGTRGRLEGEGSGGEASLASLAAEEPLAGALAREGQILVYGRLDRAAAAWGRTLPPLARPLLERLGPAALGLRLDADLTASGRMLAATEEDARAMASLIRALLGTLRLSLSRGGEEDLVEALKTVVVDYQGPVVRLEALVTGAQVRRAMAALEAEAGPAGAPR